MVTFRVSQPANNGGRGPRVGVVEKDARSTAILRKAMRIAGLISVICQDGWGRESTIFSSRITIVVSMMGSHVKAAVGTTLP